MRHIVIDGTPPAEWLEKAEQLTELLRSAKSGEERDEIIKRHEAQWKNDAFRDWLIKQFHGKCWYSESKENVSSYHVDHFRPKGRVKDLNGAFREGYWWLAFQWKNYRISGQLLNVKKLDMFPLVGGHPAQAFDDDSLQLEAPFLLDPCIADDASLLSFDESGEATHAEGIDDEDKLRVNTTIDILGLNKCASGRLVESRAITWNKCMLTILDYNNSSTLPPQQKKIQRFLMVKRLKELVRYEEEFSAVALACIKKKAPESLITQIFGNQEFDKQVTAQL